MGAIDRNIIIENQSNIIIDDHSIENDGLKAVIIKTEDNKHGQ